MTASDKQLCTLRELALAVHAFDRAFNEASNAIVGRAFTAHEIQSVLKLVRGGDPRDIDDASMQAFLRDIQTNPQPKETK